MNPDVLAILERIERRQAELQLQMSLVLREQRARKRKGQRRAGTVATRALTAVESEPTDHVLTELQTARVRKRIYQKLRSAR